MSYQDHLATCSYCNGTQNQNQKPTVRVRINAASTIRRERKLSELAALITGASYPSPSITYAADKKTNKTKGASMEEKAEKLRELAKIIRS
jgi:hypothetical protein